MAVRRLERELKIMASSPVDGITAEPIDDSDMFKWKATIAGPKDSPYEGGIFTLELNIPE